MVGLSCFASAVSFVAGGVVEWFLFTAGDGSGVASRLYNKASFVSSIRPHVVISYSAVVVGELIVTFILLSYPSVC